MKMSELRDLSADEIISKLSDIREELMKLRFQQVTGQLTDTSRVRGLRRDVARLETLTTQRLKAAEQEGKA